MKKFLSEVWGLIKSFPFSFYVVSLLCLRILLLTMPELDSKSEISLLFILLGSPIFFLVSIFELKLSESSLVWIILIAAFLLDLLILSIRQGHLKNLFKKLRIKGSGSFHKP